MKKILFFILSLATVVLFAASKHTTYSDENYSYANGTFTFNQNLVWIDFTRRVDLSFQPQSKVSTNDIATFGYYVINEDGSKGDYVTLYSKDGSTPSSSVIFSKDQTIGIFMDIESSTTKTVTVSEGKYVADRNGDYIKNKQGQYVKASGKTPYGTQRYRYVAPVTKNETTTTTERYTTTAVDDAKTAGAQIDPDSFDLADGSTHQYFCLFTQGAVDTGAHYEYFFNGIIGSSDKTIDEFIEDIKDEYGEDINVVIEDEDNTSGQPLPGVIATVILGGACIGALKRKHSKK